MDRDWLNEVVDLINSKISGSGFDCIDVEWLMGPETLRVYIDNGQEVTVDDCALINKILFEFNELDQKINKAYNLEVSSLGVEPPLRLKSHYEKYMGKIVKVKLSQKIHDRIKWAGELIEVTDQAITIIGSEQESLEIPYKVIVKAKAAYSWR